MQTYKLIFILSLLLPLISCNSKSAKDYELDAEKLEEEGKYSEAIIVLQQAIDIDPSYIGAYMNMGADKSALGNFEEAIVDYEKVLKIDSLNPMAVFNIGNNCKRMGEYQKAVEYYTTVLEWKGEFAIDPKAKFYINQNPYNFVEGGDFDVPVVALKYERGLAYYDLDSLYRSVTDFYACIQNGYNVKESRYMTGACYIKAGQTGMACDEFHAAAEMGHIDAQAMLKKYCGSIEFK